MTLQRYSVFLITLRKRVMRLAIRLSAPRAACWWGILSVKGDERWSRQTHSPSSLLSTATSDAACGETSPEMVAISEARLAEFGGRDNRKRAHLVEIGSWFQTKADMRAEAQAVLDSLSMEEERELS